MKTITNEQLSECIQELIACNAFELHIKKPDIFIPYMMNDALECYLHLKNARMTGKYNADFQGETTVKYANDASMNVLIFHQGTENVFTLWFETCYQNLSCYRYDQIGHFWVNGEEHWRRLVYIIGTIYDKYKYLGETVCTKEELALIPLMEFAPFRYYSPVSESLDAYYSDTENGFNTMVKLAEEANDTRFIKLLKLYRKFPFRMFLNKLTKALNEAERHALYELIFTKVEQASYVYPSRDYGEKMNREISDRRREVASLLAEKGFAGEYPLFVKGTTQIFAIEEHPFTILDWEHFSFKIQFMVSESKKSPQKIHFGFFKKSGNHSHIESFEYLKSL